MGLPLKCSDDDFVRVFEADGALGLSRIYGLSERTVYARRRYLESKIGRVINSPKMHDFTYRDKFPERHYLDVRDGIVIIGSDCHYWPGPASTAHRAFVKLCKELHPKAVIMNGDVVDGATISRHPSIGWENKPSVAKEIEAANERLGEIMSAVPKKCNLAWTLGNHDMRLESRISNLAPQLAKLNGVHLKDHFNIRWAPCWSAWINAEGDNPVVVKHRFKGGRYAPSNNTLHGGLSMVTGHLHSLSVHPHSDYTGTRFGVDCGTMADIYGDQFRDYMEDNPRSWRSGFCVLTFSNGELMWPEIVRVLNDKEVDFRGARIRV